MISEYVDEAEVESCLASVRAEVARRTAAGERSIKDFPLRISYSAIISRSPGNIDDDAHKWQDLTALSVRRRLEGEGFKNVSLRWFYFIWCLSGNDGLLFKLKWLANPKGQRDLLELYLIDLEW